MSITLQQAATPYVYSTSSNPAFIVQGREIVRPGGFAVTGTMALTNSMCGATTASVQAKEGYIYGNYLPVEFDTDTSYKTGFAGVFKIDPSTKSLVLIYGFEYKGSCSTSYGGETLPKQ